MLQIPDNHPIHPFIRILTVRALTQAKLEEPEIQMYVAHILLNFVDSKHLWAKVGPDEKILSVTDMIIRAESTKDHSLQRELYLYSADFLLFMLGVFPECFERLRRTRPPAYYTNKGKQSYLAASELCRPNRRPLFRKMAAQFERCVLGLNWFKEYTKDPFYQYMLREFGVGMSD